LVVLAVNKDVDPLKYSQITQIAPSSGSWNAWQLMGAPWAGGLAASQNADGRLELFSSPNSPALDIWQVASNGTQWSWQSISVPDVNFDANSTVVRDNAGSLHWFITNGPNSQQLFGMSQIAPGGAWSGWQPIPSISSSSRPTAAKYSDGTIALFQTQVFPDKALYSTYQTGGGNWSPWKSLGGQLVSNPAIAQNQDGHLEAFAIGQDNAIWHAFETDQVHHTWSGWSSLGAP
jgi:hypothetical protein